MSNGMFPKQTVERLEWVGKWLKVNGEGIYKTRKIGLDRTIYKSNLNNNRCGLSKLSLLMLSKTPIWFRWENRQPCILYYKGLSYANHLDRGETTCPIPGPQ